MKYILILFVFSHSIGQSSVNTVELDSLLTVLKNQKDDFKKVEVYNGICSYYDFDCDPKNLRIYNNKLLVLSKKIKYKRGIGLYYFNVAAFNYYQNDFDKCEKYSNKAINHFFKIGDKRGFVDASIRLSDTYLAIPKLENLKKVIDRALPTAIKFYPISAGDLYTNLGTYYNAKNKPQTALIYFNKALLFYEKSGKESSNMLLLYENFAQTYIDFSKYEQALEYINKAYELNKTEYEKHSVNIIRIKIYNHLKKYEKAIEIANENINFYTKKGLIKTDYYNETITGNCTSFLNINREKEALKKLLPFINNFSSVTLKTEAYNIISQCFFNIKEYDKALIYCNEAIKNIKKIYDYNVISNTYLIKSKIEENIGNKNEALLFYKKFSLMNMYIYEIKTKNQIDNLQYEFKINDKERKIKLLEINKLQRELLVSKQKKYLILVTISIIIIIVSLLILVFFLKKINRKNKEIEYEKLIVKKSLNEKEILLKEIHHRVKNNLQLVISILNNQSQEANQKIENFLEISNSRILSIALIHEKLYQSENLSMVNFKEYLENLIDNIKSTNKFTNKDIIIVLDIEDVIFDIEKSIPLGLIVNELIMNAFKHAFKKRKRGIINLKLKKRSSIYQLEINDNGIGSDIPNGTKKTLGLQLVKDLVFQIDGILEIKNDNGLQCLIEFQNKQH